MSEPLTEVDLARIESEWYGDNSDIMELIHEVRRLRQELADSEKAYEDAAMPLS